LAITRCFSLERVTEREWIFLRRHLLRLGQFCCLGVHSLVLDLPFHRVDAFAKHAIHHSQKKRRGQ
jgi:hypothetical protein